MSGPAGATGPKKPRDDLVCWCGGELIEQDDYATLLHGVQIVGSLGLLWCDDCQRFIKDPKFERYPTSDGDRENNSRLGWP